MGGVPGILVTSQTEKVGVNLLIVWEITTSTKAHVIFLLCLCDTCSKNSFLFSNMPRNI